MVKTIEKHFKEVNMNGELIRKIKNEAIQYHKNKKTIL
jgi:hypothetical protein